MDKAVTSEQASNFIKALVELGGIRYVDSEHIIRNTEDDSPVGVNTGIPPKRHPVAIFREGMKVGDYVVLNPFTDVLGNSPERALFTNWMCAFPGSIIRHIIHRMIEVGLSKDKDADYSVTKFVSKWIDKIDNKLLEEADRIPGLEWGKIFYDRTKRIAQFQSNIGYDELKDKFKSKIRKSSWVVFVDMLKTILQIDNSKKPESLMYESKIVSIPKIDAILHMLIDILDRINEPLHKFTDVKVDVEDLKKHLDNLDVYREATKWFASATVSTDAEKIAAAESVAPWRVGTTVNSNGEVAAVSSPDNPAAEAATIAQLTPVGIIGNETFGRGPIGGYAPYIQPPRGYGMPAYGGGYGGYGYQEPQACSIAELRPW